MPPGHRRPLLRLNLQVARIGEVGLFVLSKISLESSRIRANMSFPRDRRVFRALATFLVGWTLIMPPGMCICQFVRGETVRIPDRTCPDDDKDICQDCCGNEAQLNGVLDGNQRMPRGDQHPPGCPANKKVDNSRLVGRHHLQGLTNVAAAPPLFFFAVSVTRLHADLLPVRVAEQPIYLAICSLLI